MFCWRNLTDNPYQCNFESTLYKLSTSCISIHVAPDRCIGCTSFQAQRCDVCIISNLEFWPQNKSNQQSIIYGPNYPTAYSIKYTLIQMMMWSGIELSDTGKFVWRWCDDTGNEFDLRISNFSVVAMDHHKSMWHRSVCSPYISTRHQRNVYMGYRGIL
jgi:hypothetical protein